MGCGYVECHTAENAGGAYYIYAADGGATLTNCYSEQDQPPSQVSGNVFVIGGVMEAGAGFTGTSDYFGGSRSQMYASDFLGKALIDFPISGVTAWTPGLAVATGKTVAPQKDGVPTTGYIYQAQNDGTTGGKRPDFPAPSARQ